MRNVILALTNSEDGKHSDAVISKLTKSGERVLRFDSDRFSTGETTIAFSLQSKSCFTIAGKIPGGMRKRRVLEHDLDYRPWRWQRSGRLIAFGQQVEGRMVSCPLFWRKIN